MSIQIMLPLSDIAALCQRYRIRRLALFGSALRDDFCPDSDIDLLAEFEPGTRVSLAQLLEAEAALSALLGRPVDLGERQAVEEDPNYLRRKHILESATVIYEAG